MLLSQIEINSDVIPSIVISWDVNPQHAYAFVAKINKVLDRVTTEYLKIASTDKATVSFNDGCTSIKQSLRS